MSTAFFFTLFVAFWLILLSRATTVVRENEVAVIEQLGKYSRTLTAGFHLIVPFVERVRATVTLVEQDLPLPAVSYDTRDSHSTFVKGSISYRITDPRKAIYDVADYKDAVSKCARRAIESAAIRSDFVNFVNQRAFVSQHVVRDTTETCGSFGVEIVACAIDGISKQSVVEP